jgi:hypothetical protein
LDQNHAVRHDIKSKRAGRFGPCPGFTHYNDGKSGYLAQSALPLYFGLGDATRIDRVEVDWPSGKKQVVTTGLDINHTLQITETK